MVLAEETFWWLGYKDLNIYFRNRHESGTNHAFLSNSNR